MCLLSQSTARALHAAPTAPAGSASATGDDAAAHIDMWQTVRGGRSPFVSQVYSIMVSRVGESVMDLRLLASYHSPSISQKLSISMNHRHEHHELGI